MSSYNNILKELDKINEASEESVYIPSMRGTTAVKPINIKKQKDIIKSSIDPSSTSLAFNLCINKIIAECVDSEKVLVSDKPAVMIAMRNSNIGAVYNGTIDDTTVSIPLSDVISKYAEIDTALVYKTKVESGNITVNLTIPDLETDNKFMLACARVVKAPGAGDYSQVSDNISEMFVYEVAKFVSSIQFRSEAPALSGGEATTELSSVRFNELPAGQCIKLIEMLPVTMNQGIVKYISSIREYEELFTAVTFDDKPLHLPVDASLFTLE